MGKEWIGESGFARTRLDSAYYSGCMSDSEDLREFLIRWPYDADHNARIVKMPDNRVVLQVRLPMGIEQYELEGRPDGLRPHGAESAFDYHVSQLSQARERGTEDTYRLDEAACAELFAEGMLYYYRYLHLFQLNDWKRTVRDTTRNLSLFDFVRDHAEREDDRVYLEQWRPYLTRMNATARVMMCLEDQQYEEALRIIELTLHEIESMRELDADTYQYERERSVTALRSLKRQIQKSRPVSVLEQLEGKLRKAVDAEEFEKAAKLRDQIRALGREHRR